MSEVSKDEYDDTPTGVYKRWQDELESGKKFFENWTKDGKKIVKKFLDERMDEQDQLFPTTHLNLYHSNIVTLMAMLYGSIPKVEVDRRYADADDDVARVAGEMLTRILNTDIETAGEDLASVFRNCLQDRLIPGLGSARCQYKFETAQSVTEAIKDEQGNELAPRVEEEKIGDEWVDIVYTHWQDILWSPARTYAEIRWRAFRSYMTKKEFEARFPDIDVKTVTFSTKAEKNKMDGVNPAECLQQAEVWEIWSKVDGKTYWFTEGPQKILDQQDDPLEIENFWPDPPPLIANTTTSKYIPRSDFKIAQDLYREIDELETRISILTDACKAVGVYDKSSPDIGRIFDEAVESQLIPVDNWAQFSEKGGLEGVINWVPIEDIVNTITQLTQRQDAKIQQLYQVTGMNDVMRGAASEARVSATERKLQANYGSIRIEALQNEFARFVSDLQGIKAEIIAKHYQIETIIRQSNIMSTPDAPYAQAAAMLIKDPNQSRWRIQVRPETLAIADYAQLKQDRTEYINALAVFMQSAAPLIEMEPGALPTLLKLLKWGMAGFRGSNEIEGVLDQEIDKITKQQKEGGNEKPDPEAQKAQMEMKKMEMEMQMAQQENAADQSMQKEKHQMEMQQMQMKFQLEMQQMEKKFQLEMTKLQAEVAGKQQIQQAELEANTAEHVADVELTQVQGQQKLEQQEQQHSQSMRHTEAATAQKLDHTKKAGEVTLAQKKAEAKLKPKGPKK